MVVDCDEREIGGDARSIRLFGVDADVLPSIIVAAQERRLALGRFGRGEAVSIKVVVLQITDLGYALVFVLRQPMKAVQQLLKEWAAIPPGLGRKWYYRQMPIERLSCCFQSDALRTAELASASDYRGLIRSL